MTGCSGLAFMARGRGSGHRVAGDQSGEGLALHPQQVEGDQADDGQRDIRQDILRHERVEGDDVEDDGAQELQADVAGARDGDHDPTQQFEHLDEMHVAGGNEGSHEHGHGRPGGWRRLIRDQLEQEHHGERDEGESEQATGDVGEVFHVK